MNTIYKPKGRALEYGEYALNIYEGCIHGCLYCYVPQCLHKEKEVFHNNFQERKNIVEETKKFLLNWGEKGKHIHLCFTCDPYPYRQDQAATDSIIEAIHESGNYVQILTKGYPNWFGNLLPDDIFGVTISCDDEQAKIFEPKALAPSKRIELLKDIKKYVGCKTFVSCEPVINPDVIFDLIRLGNYIDEFKIGMLNHISANNEIYPKFNWGEFGRGCEWLCKKYERNYYIKEGLRKEMGKE